MPTVGRALAWYDVCVCHVLEGNDVLCIKSRRYVFVFVLQDIGLVFVRRVLEWYDVRVIECVCYSVFRDRTACCPSCTCMI